MNNRGVGSAKTGDKHSGEKKRGPSVEAARTVRAPPAVQRVQWSVVPESTDPADDCCRYVDSANTRDLSYPRTRRSSRVLFGPAGRRRPTSNVFPSRSRSVRIHRALRTSRRRERDFRSVFTRLYTGILV